MALGNNDEKKVSLNDDHSFISLFWHPTFAWSLALRAEEIWP
jgi:hypothetical protein